MWHKYDVAKIQPELKLLPCHETAGKTLFARAGWGSEYEVGGQGRQTK